MTNDARRIRAEEKMTEAYFCEAVGNSHGNEVYMEADGDAAKLARRIYGESDDDGTIQARQMVKLFPGQPERHTTTSLYCALLMAGCEEAK